MRPDGRWQAGTRNHPFASRGHPWTLMVTRKRREGCIARGKGPRPSGPIDFPKRREGPPLRRSRQAMRPHRRADQAGGPQPSTKKDAALGALRTRHRGQSARPRGASPSSLCCSGAVDDFEQPRSRVTDWATDVEPERRNQTWPEAFEKLLHTAVRWTGRRKTRAAAPRPIRRSPRGSSVPRLTRGCRRSRRGERWKSANRPRLPIASRTGASSRASFFIGDKATTWTL
jgi:hypothetical protein